MNKRALAISLAIVLVAAAALLLVRWRFQEAGDGVHDVAIVRVEQDGNARPFDIAEAERECAALAAAMREAAADGNAHLHKRGDVQCADQYLDKEFGDGWRDSIRVQFDGQVFELSSGIA